MEIYEERKINDQEIKFKLDEARLTFKELERVKKDQDEENLALKNDNNGLKYRVEGLEKELVSLKKQSIREITEKARISEELEKIHQELGIREEKLKEMYEKKEKYIKDIENQLTMANSKVHDLSCISKKLETDKSTLQEKTKNDTTQLKTIISELTEKLLKEQEKTKNHFQLEDSFKQLSADYQTIHYNYEQSQLQLKALSTSLQKSQDSYESEILRLKTTISETTFVFEEKFHQLEYEKTRAESDLKKVKTEHTSYETTSKKAHSEIEL